MTIKYNERDPSQEEVNRLFEYDSETGNLIWRERPREDFATLRAMKIWNTRFAGKVAGCVRKDGYRGIRINGKDYFAHRLIYILHCGSISEGMQIDHISGDPLNNRINNLRLASSSENSRNTTFRSDNQVGVKNVSIHAAGGYNVRVMVDGKIISKSSVNWTIEEAATYAANLRDELHGEFARHV